MVKLILILKSFEDKNLFETTIGSFQLVVA